MSPVLVDTDFLSSLLKIGRCDLIRSLYPIEQVVIPAAVHRELAQTDLLAGLLAIPWITVWLQEPASDGGPLADSGHEALGLGEQACILIARSMPGAIMLTNDNVARRFAQAEGILAVSIPAFLLACKSSGLLDVSQMAQIIDDLRDKDYYEFRVEVRDLLLAQ